MHSDRVPTAAYEIAGRRWVKGAPGFAEAIAHAFELRLRPRCLCLRNPEGQGIEMYVARLMDGYIIKRMPTTGSQHDINCLSYEPPHDFTGLGQLQGSAIVENPATGETTLKLDFTLTKRPGCSQMPSAGEVGDSSATSDGSRLSLRGLLHYLWYQAELMHWHPWFEGKRSWSTVRKLLTKAAEKKIVRGHSLQSMLYIPEVFCVEQREAINTRRYSQWLNAVASPGRPHRLMLMIAEVKEIAPAKFGHLFVMKHVPDQAFALDDQLYRRLIRRFEALLSLWGTSKSLHMVVIATFFVSERGFPSISELYLMPVTSHWLPIENSFEQQLFERLVREGRSFVKGPLNNQVLRSKMGSAILIDSGSSPIPLCISQMTNGCDGQHGDNGNFETANNRTRWKWDPNSGAIPPLPDRNQCVEKTRQLSSHLLPKL